MPVMAIADAPIASSSIVGAESARFENGAWTALTTLAPRARFEKNNGAYPERFVGAGS